MSESRMSRRTAVKTLAAVGLGGLVEAPSTAAAPGGPPHGRWWQDPPDLIMIIRHGEKPTGTGAPYGITAAGVQDSESLTTTGWARAGALVELFAPAVGHVRRGLARPTALFASNQTGPAGGSAREVETISFVAAQLGVAINSDYGVGDESQLVAVLAKTRGPILVCWEHDHIPTIADDLGTVTPAVPQTWPSSRFDVVWVFVRAPSGRSSSPSYRFYQVPELLLPGDLATTIT
jgi:hypothetical protein